MLSSSRTERAKPLLGTTVRVRVEGLAQREAQAAINAAFAEIAVIHALMSFHEADSDVSRLNREAYREPVMIDARTYAVLEHAQVISALSDGAFDITIGGQLGAWRSLPSPAAAPVPDAGAIWRDVELLPDNRVQFRRPLWIDLGGIAKGFAVDRAMEILATFAPAQACVNAGGDLRVSGSQTERVVLTPDHFDEDAVPVMEICDGSLASSNGAIHGRRVANGGVHVDTRRGLSRAPRQFVSVTAPACVDADALTIVVMARGACSLPALAALDANAVVYDTQFGWRQIASSS